MSNSQSTGSNRHKNNSRPLERGASRRADTSILKSNGNTTISARNAASSQHREGGRAKKAKPEVSYAALLSLLGSREFDELARMSQGKLSTREKGVHEARHELAGLGVGIYQAIKGDASDRARFNEAFERVTGREPKQSKIIRDVFLLVHGLKREHLAGTDAYAMADAIRRRINPLEIPAYIDHNGGLEKLLEKERARRDPMAPIKVRFCKSMRTRMEKLAPGGCISVKIFRTNAKASWNYFEVPRGD